jgi:hypothetical protein
MGEIVLGAAVTLLTGERGIQWYRSWQSARRESREDVQSAAEDNRQREGVLHARLLAMYEAEYGRAEKLVAELSLLQHELHTMERHATGEQDRRCRCEEELARVQGLLAGSLRRIAELEEQLRTERQTSALMLADALQRTVTRDDMGATSPEPRPFPLADDYDDPEHDTDPPEET